MIRTLGYRYRGEHRRRIIRRRRRPGTLPLAAVLALAWFRIGGGRHVRAPH